MFIAKLRIAAAVLLAASLIGVDALGTDAAEPEKAPVDLSALDKRIAEILPTAKEKRFDEIGWAKGIRDAERLAKESGRPVFLFSNVGQLDIGRC